MLFLSDVDKPDRGTIAINEVDLSSMDEKSLGAFRSENLGIVFQQFHLMSSLSALENVCLPLDIAGKSNSQKLALEALNSVGLDSRSHHLPSQLSGGECQRVAIARAFVAKPKLLLADEPSGNGNSTVFHCDTLEWIIALVLFRMPAIA